MARARKFMPAEKSEPVAILAGFDLNSSRARGVFGQAGTEPRPLQLEETHEDLPMCLSLGQRHIKVGRAGSGLCRQSPHLVCFDFLAALGESRRWQGGRHRLDAGKALALVFERLNSVCQGVNGLVASVPAYLTRAQAGLLGPLAQKARLPLLGTVPAPLALALAAHAAEPWMGTALVLDVDDHALTAGLVFADDTQLSLRSMQSVPQLNLRVWKGRLLDMVAERCIRQSRRDPRDSAPAEQSLYDQLEDTLEASARGRVVELLIQTPHWFQNLLLRPEEYQAACRGHVRQTLENCRQLLSTAARDGLATVLVTSALSRLPGLVISLEDLVRQPAAVPDAVSSEDFGEDLIQGVDAPVRVRILAREAGACGAHDLASRILVKEVARGHIDLAIPLTRHPGPAPATASKRSFRVLSADEDS